MTSTPQLRLYNSLTKQKDVFVPKSGDKIRWFCCGPTFSNEIHMGHVRHYMSLDILRRIMKNCFGYDLIFYVHVNDLKEKFIERAREEYFKKKNPIISSTDRAERLDDRPIHIKHPSDVHFGAPDKDKKKSLSPQASELPSYSKSFLRSTIKDEDLNSITKQFEQTFNQYRMILNVNSPDTITYTTIVSAAREGTETSATPINTTTKKSQWDFILWQQSSQNEISFMAPFGPGKPGWDIECSVIATSVLQLQFDIHTGGTDVKFPHHYNEQLQLQQEHHRDKCINYYIQIGHLLNNGLKMSNSMGNVVTLEEMLKKYSPVHIRLYFLIHSWFSTLSYSDYGIDDAVKYEKMLNEFFRKVEPHLRSIKQLQPSNRIKFDEDDLKMHQCKGEKADPAESIGSNRIHRIHRIQ